MKKSKGPCWSGYEMIGMKDKGGKKVPNCVPVKKRKHGSCSRNIDAGEQIDMDGAF